MVTMLFDAGPFVAMTRALVPDITIEEVQWLVREALFDTLAIGISDHHGSPNSAVTLSGELRVLLCNWIWVKLHPIRYYDLRHEVSVNLTEETITIRGVM